MAVSDWLGITENTLGAIDELDDELVASLSGVLEKSFQKVSREMVRTFKRLEGADPAFIKVELSKLKQLTIARKLLNSKQLEVFEAQLEKVLQQTTDEGVRYADLMTEALSNPPELVEQFGVINIKASAIALQAGNRLRNHTKDAAKKITEAVSENLLRGGSVRQLTKTIKGALGTTKARAETIARTETVTVLNETSRQRYQQYGAEYVQIIAIVDKRTTAWCRYRHLKVIKITESLPSYHFNCRTTTAPTDPAWISKDDLKWMMEEQKRAKETGLLDDRLAPFDKKKPKFIAPSTFSERKSTVKKIKVESQPKSIESKTIYDSSKDELIDSGRAYINKYLDSNQSLSRSAFSRMSKELVKRGEKILNSNKSFNIFEHITFTERDADYIEPAYETFLQYQKLMGGIVFEGKKLLFINNKPRAYYKANIGQQNGTIFDSINVGKKDKDLKQSLLHELGHYTEENLKDSNGKRVLIEQSAKFVLDKATGKEKLLSELTGIEDYQDEKAYPDDFYNPYAGKLYKNVNGNFHGTEVFSMGLEHFIEGENGETFREKLDHVAYTVGVILAIQESNKTKVLEDGN